MEELKIYTVERVAALLEVTPRTIYSRIKRGEIHPVKRGGKWYFTEKTLKDYMEEE